MPDALIVEYHLELDEWTVVSKEVKAVLKPDELAKLERNDYYPAFVKSYGPLLADYLTATLDGKELRFTCVKHNHQVTDSVQCDFIFRAAWNPSVSQTHRLELKETAWEYDPGRIDLALAPESTFAIREIEAPDESLRKKALTELRPGELARLRTLRVIFAGPELLPPPRSEGGETPAPVVAQPSHPSHPPHSLLQLAQSTQYGVFMLMILSAWVGAVHALTPGHGKTLVAAYLVGERGTAMHAVMLGLVTALTHTGAVLILAAILLIRPDLMAGMQKVLGFVGGLMVAALGAWLLLRRLAGKADHVHLGGAGHHHHHHDHGHPHDHDHAESDHSHDEHGHAHPAPATTEPLGWWGLIILGVRGGMLPCTDAIALFGWAVSTSYVWLALPMLLAFSAGLAAVLVIVGVMVVRMKGLAGSRWGETRFFRLLPVLSALIVTGLGLWLCYDSLHSAPTN
jgi:ABC-type nickel/cobalt efflux system permease component RcnA